MPAMKPKARDDLATIEFEDEIVVFAGHGDHSHLHYLDPAATLAFRLCDGTATVAETAAELAAAQGAPADQVERSFRDYVRGLRRMGLLTAKPVIRTRPTPADGDDDHAEAHEHEHHHGVVVDERGRIRKEVPRSD
jgi:hypothetical protein